MIEDEFRAFLEHSVPEYASEKVKAGNWTPEEALARSQKDHASLLPEGMATPNQHLYTIELDGTPVGRLWLSVDPKTAGGAGFVYDLFVAEPFRRQGIAAEAAHLEAVGSLAIVINTVGMMEHVCYPFCQGVLRHTDSNEWKEILMNQGTSATNKATPKSAESATATGKTSEGFTDEERAAMKEHVKELKAEVRANEEDRSLARISSRHTHRRN